MTQDQHKLEPVAHVHSNGDFCADRQITSKDWPVYLYTEAQVNELRAHLQQRPLPVRDDETMRAEFMAWVESQGCDTDGAWSAWQGCWNLLHGSVSAVLIPAKHWDKNVVHEWSGPLPVIDGTERDALRYRWLRDTGYWYTSPKGSPWAVIGTGAGDAMPCCGQELDAAIDAGMADMPPASPSLPVREEPTPEQLRAEFERRWRLNPANPSGTLGKNEHGDYLSMFVHGCWSHFKAGAAFASPSVQNMGEGETGKDGVNPSHGSEG